MRLFLAFAFCCFLSVALAQEPAPDYMTENQKEVWNILFHPDRDYREFQLAKEFLYFDILSAFQSTGEELRVFF